MSSLEAHDLVQSDARAGATRARGSAVYRLPGADERVRSPFIRPPVVSQDPLCGDARAVVDRLERENEGLRAFASTVSHDLRSRFGALALYLTALSERAGGALDPADMRVLETSRRLVAEMDDVLAAHLLLAACGERPPEGTEIDVSAIVADEMRSLRNVLPGLTAQVTIQPGMVAVADPDLVRIVFRQLLENAIRALTVGSDSRIEIGMESRGGEQVFYVGDNGVGFDPIEAERVFRPYERLHRERYTGSGLGLPIVKRIIDCHGGWVRADAAVGDGATFSFTLAPPADAGRAGA